MRLLGPLGRPLVSRTVKFRFGMMGSDSFLHSAPWDLEDVVDYTYQNWAAPAR